MLHAAGPAGWGSPARSWSSHGCILRSFFSFPRPKGALPPVSSKFLRGYPRAVCPLIIPQKGARYKAGARRFRITWKWGPHRCGPHQSVFGRRGVLLHLSGFPCQYQRRVAATKLTTSNTGLILCRFACAVTRLFRQKGPCKPLTGSSSTFASERHPVPCFCFGRRRALAKDRPLPLLRFGCFCRRQRLSYAASRTANPTG